MPESETYSYRVTKAVDKVKSRFFSTAAIGYIAANSLTEVMPHALHNSNTILHRMKCVKVETAGSGRIADDWKIVFEPGSKCKGCNFFKKNKTSKFHEYKCARVERAESTSSEEPLSPES